MAQRYPYLGKEYGSPERLLQNPYFLECVLESISGVCSAHIAHISAQCWGWVAQR